MLISSLQQKSILLKETLGTVSNLSSTPKLFHSPLIPHLHLLVSIQLKPVALGEY